MKPAYHPIYPTPKIEDRDREGEFVKFEGKEQTHLSEKHHKHMEARSRACMITLNIKVAIKC
jgi:hypothetical protein